MLVIVANVELSVVNSLNLWLSVANMWLIVANMWLSVA